MSEAIEIGTRCAGSPTTMLPAHEGYRVLLVDKAKFPSDIIHGADPEQSNVERREKKGERTMSEMQTLKPPSPQEQLFDIFSGRLFSHALHSPPNWA